VPQQSGHYDDDDDDEAILVKYEHLRGIYKEVFATPSEITRWCVIRLTWEVKTN
jgi:hypothetical protein